MAPLREAAREPVGAPTTRTAMQRRSEAASDADAQDQIEALLTEPEELARNLRTAAAGAQP